jgi:DUF1009 family protein
MEEHTSLETEAHRVALLAGSGAMPLRILEQLAHLPPPRAPSIHLLAIRGITDGQTIALAHHHGFAVTYYTLFQLGKTLHYCIKQGIDEITLAGKIEHRSIFSLSPWRFDLTTMKLWFSLKNFKTDTILTAIVNLFESRNIHVASSMKYLEPYITPEGLLSRITPTSATAKDIAFGIPIARELGRLDIGQTLLVKNGAIISVEAIEGTDRCIRRAGELAGKGCTMIKVAKPQQDMRFDVPVLGRQTLEELLAIGASALAIEAHRSLILDPEILELAHNSGFAIIGFLTDQQTYGI